jgi:predicted transcriptional regulator
MMGNINCPLCPKAFDSDFEFRVHWQHSHFGPVPAAKKVAIDASPPAVVVVEESGPEYALATSKQGLGELCPVLKDKFGNIIDGFHRKGENAAWREETLEWIDTPEKLEAARLAVNFARRKMASEEIRERITHLIKSGLKVEEIAKLTGITPKTVYKYMPQEAKNAVMSERGSTRSLVKTEVSRETDESCANRVQQSSKIHDDPMVPRVRTFAEAAAEVAEKTVKVAESSFADEDVEVVDEVVPEGCPICPCCVKPDTIIPGDYMPISEVTPGKTMVFGLVGTQEIRQKMSRPYSGKLVTVKAMGLMPLEVTAEHPLLTCTSLGKKDIQGFSTLAWIPAEQLRPKKSWTNGNYLVVPRLSGNNTITELDLLEFAGTHGKAVAIGKNVPLAYPLTFESTWLLGMYIANGWTTLKGVSFSLNALNTDLHSKIMDIASKLGYSPCKHTSRRGSTVVEIPSRLLSRAISSWCKKGAINKQIPTLILLNCNLSLLQSLLQGYEDGDGCCTPNGVRMSTVSRILVMQLQLAYARLGLFASISPRRKIDEAGLIEGRKVKLHKSFQITVTKKFVYKNAIRVRIFDNYILTPINKVSTTQYIGDVWNIETVDNTYLVSNAVVHNCGSSMDISEFQEVKRKFRTKYGLQIQTLLFPGGA